ncbi:pyrimidine 5-nucleotidase [Tothia fuscella]|uniref:Pyrimidine 5-nucleotidase n=1 Tax=Tothia fuscella TaxID=1048955 RepID=A0A9P4NPU9_9PEZI|nr:pyrimidine 5-nucleotidase [Tothia fuscella]
MAKPSNSKPVLFFDIDNCLYPKSTKILHLMSDLIDEYFITHLSLSQRDAANLHQKYYQDYGLAIEGLVRHHTVDPMDFNRKVDNALPLEDILKPDPKLQKLLSDIDTSKVKLWLLTNAHVTHGKRVVKLLGVERFFEGITYCDYNQEKLLAKPHKDMYLKAMRDAGAESVGDCYFVDDSYMNAKGAATMGWSVAHLVDPSDALPVEQASQYQIRSLEELRDVFPQFFKSESGD